MFSYLAIYHSTRWYQWTCGIQCVFQTEENHGKSTNLSVPCRIAEGCRMKSRDQSPECIWTNLNSFGTFTAETTRCLWNASDQNKNYVTPAHNCWPLRMISAKLSSSLDSSAAKRVVTSKWWTCCHAPITITCCTGRALGISGVLIALVLYLTCFIMFCINFQSLCLDRFRNFHLRRPRACFLPTGCLKSANHFPSQENLRASKTSNIVSSNILDIHDILVSSGMTWYDSTTMDAWCTSILMYLCNILQWL